MSLFNFVKDAGEKVLDLAQGKPEALNEARALSIKQHIKNLGLDVDDLGIKIEEDSVTIAGSAADHETREKALLAVGNIRGVARVKDSMTVEGEAGAVDFYTVKSGDTLSAIAKRFYGNAMKYPVIFEANKPMLKNPDRIYPGQVLRIPPLK
jgi:nucleoid-associated protein YgaU